MTERVLSAPGKLFLAGEYSVLWGGRSWVLAVDSRVNALARRRTDRTVVIALAEGSLRGEVTPLGVKWGEPVMAAFHFAARTIDLACRILGREGPGLAIAIEPSPLSNGHKLGLGSSARATVLTSEMARWCWEATFDALKLALVAHADSQSGKGSGADVAACFAGELIRYRKFDVAAVMHQSKTLGLGGALLSSGPVDVVRSTPAQLPMLFAFTGHAAVTPSLIDKAERQLNEAQRAAFVLNSDALGEALSNALTQGHFAQVIEATVELQKLLSTIEATHSESLNRILAIAAAHGCAAKQSGAGGGDGAIIIAPDAHAITAVKDSLETRGFFTWQVKSAKGVQGEGLRPKKLGDWLDAAE